MKNINLSVDGGGTSLRIIAFDDDLNLIAQSISGPVNPNFETVEKIGENMSNAIKLLFADLIKSAGNFKIKKIYRTIVGSVSFFDEIFMKHSGDFAGETISYNISEGHSHLFAASLGDNGGIALAGTGSGAIYCNKDKIIHLGGFGTPVGDEGSGAWIGLQGMSAAVRYINGWGEKTILTEKLYEYLNINSPNLITGILYRKDINQRNLFAGFCKSVAECERLGDTAASEIIYSAGREMGLQMISILQRAENKNMIGNTKPIAIYASGGAWKGTPYMLETMNKTIRAVYPDAVCTHGLFDPVMAGVIKFIFDKTGSQAIPERIVEHLKKEFKSYLFEFDKF
jgi:glucosamine kinase